MSALGFVLIAGMLAAYVLLDGYDLGVGALHLVVARDRAQRSAAMASIGPYWNGNEVWLIATGGVLFALFPRVYAAAFSGFYLPLMIVLWLLMIRGISLELRNHSASPLWQDFFDVAFSFSSALLVLLYGVAFGNVIRGVPLDANGAFFGTFGELLNPYAVAVGVFAVLALAAHGAAYLAMRTQEELGRRARRAASALWPVVLAGFAAVTAATFAVRPDAARNFLHLPPLAVLPLLSVAGIVAGRTALARGDDPNAFRASLTFLAGSVASGAATIFPYLLPRIGSDSGLSVYDYATGRLAMATGVAVSIIGLCAVVSYAVYAGRSLRGTQDLKREP